MREYIYKYSTITLVVLIAALVAGIVLGAVHNTSQNNAIRSECEKTDYVVIGNDGRPEVIYDCSGAKKVIETD